MSTNDPCSVSLYSVFSAIQSCCLDERMVNPQLPMTLRTSKKRATFLSLCSLAFVVGGIMALPSDPLVGVFTIVFFGLCALVGLLQFHPRASTLTITTDGFTICALFREKTYRWSDIESFGLMRVARRLSVGWDFSAQYHEQQRLRGVAAALSGRESMLPDNYGLPARELLDLLSTCHQVYR